MVKVVHVTTLDKGGAYKAVCRIVECMETDDIDCSVLLRSKTKDGKEIENNSNLFKNIWSKSKNLINMLFANDYLQNDIMGSDISNNQLIKEADIIFIHWVSSFLNYKSIYGLLKRKKIIVLVLHDMEHFTGGCHYSLNCEGYKEACKKCEYATNPLIKYGINCCNKYKRKVWQDENCHIVAISEWIKETAKKSKVVISEESYKADKINRIWNPVNTDIFKPKVTEEYRKKEGIDERPVILFGADRLGDKVKGVEYIFEALKFLDNTKYNVVCFGTEELPEKYKDEYSFVRCLGRIDEEAELATIYSMATVFVVTSVQEAFGYTCCEALACGTPVVAFDVGGLHDQISHKECGYLADLYDCKGVAEGVEWCLKNYDKMQIKAIESVNTNFSYRRIGKGYIDLVRKLL